MPLVDEMCDNRAMVKVQSINALVLDKVHLLQHAFKLKTILLFDKNFQNTKYLLPTIGVFEG